MFLNKSFPDSALLFLDHFTLPAGFLGSAIHDIYWHIKYRKKKIEEKINLTKSEISKKLHPTK